MRGANCPVEHFDIYLKGMKMETKRKIAGLFMVVVFTALMIYPTYARKYDTMMVGADRWIDNNANQKIQEQAYEIATNTNSTTNDTKPNLIAFYEGQDEPNEIIYYDGQLEPNMLVLIYHPEEPPEHPNELIIEGGLEPNLAILFDNLVENPEHPNQITIEQNQPNVQLIILRAEHPGDPNDLSSEEEIDPNDIEKIILDEGTANHRKEDPTLQELS
jgi:hypothetical protein